MKPPIRTKITHQPSPSSKVGGGQTPPIKTSTQDSSEGSGEFSDEIDEYIKKHIENEEREKKK